MQSHLPSLRIMEKHHLIFHGALYLYFMKISTSITIIIDDVDNVHNSSCLESLVLGKILGVFCVHEFSSFYVFKFRILSIYISCISIYTKTFFSEFHILILLDI